MRTISLVIPAFNEAQHLPDLLCSVSAAQKRYAGGAKSIEIIIADNASTDRTADIARAHGCRVTTVEKRTIAAARNGGARVAAGEILAFVDADSLIHPETFNAIETALTDSVVVGATCIRMSRTSPGIALTMLIGNAIMRIGGLDSGVVFCRRADWEAVGGYNENYRFAEDVRFLWDLKRLGRSRGQRFARALNAPTITSARKFDQYGDWHWFNGPAKALFWYLFSPGKFRRFIDDYWYQRR
ncbi:MAG: glycosyltransferase [Gammaproteobacteria bacterium]|nr:glycosyltransferase [Gammaproteobacteria bacterium]